MKRNTEKQKIPVRCLVHGFIIVHVQYIVEHLHRFGSNSLLEDL